MSKEAGPTSAAGAPRIVIVTYNWPPRNAIGTHRPLSWARAWAANGAKVTVLTAKKYAFDEPLDLPNPDIPGVKVIEVPYLGRRSGLSGLARIGWVKAVLRKLKWLVGGRMSSADVRLGWWKAAHDIAVAEATRNDIVVSTFGPSAAHLIAADMKRANPALRWVADYRDPWHQNVYSGAIRSEALREKVRALELETLAGADAVTAVSSGLAEQVGEGVQKPAFSVPNGFDAPEHVVRETIARAAARTGEGDDEIRLVYTGMIYREAQDTQPLFEALHALQREGAFAGKRVVCDFYGSNVQPVEALARDSRFKPLIAFHGHVTRDQALESQKSATALILFDNLNPEARGVLTGKIFEYLTSGKPILSIGSRPDSPIARLLRYTGCGVVADTPDGIRSALADVVGGEAPAWFSPSVERILEFSRDRAAEAMFSIVTGEPAAGTARGQAEPGLAI
jgi:glycosyltransferase involved in cell wall biosynthesis